MTNITETVQASQLDGSTVRAVIRDGKMRLVTYHGQPECLLVKLPDNEADSIEAMLAELRHLLTAAATKSEG